MKYKNIIFLLFITVLLSTSCNTESGNKTDEHGTENKEDSHEHGAEGGESTETSLTDEQIKSVEIKFGKIEYRSLSPEIEANGILRVSNKHKANATSLFGGAIQNLYIQNGDYVKKGQVIATISNPQFIQQQEEFIALESKITLAEQEQQRQKELNEGNAGALKNYQNAQAELNILRTKRAALQQQIKLMGINPNTISNGNLKSQLTIVSPINGVVSDVFAKIGSYVDTSIPVAEIIDNSSIHLDLQLFEKDLPLVKIGQKISFSITNNPSTIYQAQVFNIGSSFEGDSKTIAVHCQILGSKSGLIDGMNIVGTINISNATVPAVPNNAIVMAENKHFIFLVNEQEEKHAHNEEHDHDHSHDKKTRFKKVEVVIGSTQNGYTMITPVEELPADTHIVVNGAFFVNAKMSNSGEGHSH